MAARGVIEVLRLIWRNGDRLIDLLDHLPATLKAAGQGMESAGEGAALAATALDGGPDGGAGAASALKEATAALEQVRRQVESIAESVRMAADAMDEFTIPTVTPRRQRFNLKLVGLGEPELVTGLDIREERPAFVEGITLRIRSQAEMLDTRLSEDLGKATEKLDRLSDSLTESGMRIRSVGDSLKAGGAALKGLKV